MNLNDNEYLSYLAYCEELRKQGKTPDLFNSPLSKFNKGHLIKNQPTFFGQTHKYNFSKNIYDDVKQCLNVFNKCVSIPPDSNQHYLCKVLFLKYHNMLKDFDNKECKLIRQGRKVWEW